MERSLKNKNVVITGGAQGIGYQIADKFLGNGAKTVLILDTNIKEGTNTIATLNGKYGAGKTVFIHCDVTKDLEEVSRKIFEEYQEVDVLVNNAGTVNENSVKETIEVNVIAVMEWSMKFFKHMRKDTGGKGGTIINVGSVYSYVVDPYAVYYKSSKHAVMGFTRTLGHQDNFQRFGVRVMIVCPGFTNTNLAATAAMWKEHEETFAKYVTSMILQEADVVGDAAVKIFENGNSGSAWKCIGGIVDEIPVYPYQDGIH